MNLAEAEWEGVLYHVGDGPQVVRADADEVREGEARHVDDHDDAGNLESTKGHGFERKS